MPIEGIHAQMYIQPACSLHTSKLRCLCSCPQSQLVCLFSSLEETEKRDLPIRHRQIKESLTSLGECYTPALHLSKDQKTRLQRCWPAPQQRAGGGTCWDPPFTAHSRWTCLCSPGSEPWNNTETLKRNCKGKACHTSFLEAVLLSQSTQRHTVL